MLPDAKILDLIYEASFLPEHWTRVLDHMAQATNAHGTALFTVSAAAMRSIASPSLDDLTQKMITEGWAQRNTRAARLLTIEQQGFIDEADYFTQADYDTQPIFTEVMKPLGYGFGTSTSIRASADDSIIFAVEKKKATGPVEKSAIAYLDTLRPHLARAALMSSRLEFERINAAVQALELTGLASAVLSHAGRVIAANSSFEKLTPRVMINAGDRLNFSHRPANQIFQQALAQLAGDGAAGRSFALSATETAPPAIVHVVPISGDVRDIFTGAACFVIFTPIDRSRLHAGETLQGLFDLSPSEARVARLLANGDNAANVAASLSLSVETVRTHVKAVLAKSGMSRQAEFVAAVASLPKIV